MTNYRRNFLAGASYFFTANLANRRSRLLIDHVDLLRAAFREVRARHPFAIEAIVVLPDHIHTIWTLPDGEADFAVRWRLIKSVFSRALPRRERENLPAERVSDVRLIVPSAVVTEIERHKSKGNSRTARRAREASALLLPVIDFAVDF